MVLVKLSGRQISFTILNRFVDTPLGTAPYTHKLTGQNLQIYDLFTYSNWHETRKGHY
jgi:hypothetical protein